MKDEITFIAHVIEFLVWRSSTWLYVFEIIPMTKDEEIKEILFVFSSLTAVKKPVEIIRECLADPKKEAKLYKLLAAIVETCYKFDEKDVLKGCSEEFKNKIFAFKFGDANV